MLDGLRAVFRSLRMTARWPSYEYARYLDRPLDELRREFGIRVLRARGSDPRATQRRQVLTERSDR